jgi:hypothetical protein
MIGSLFINLWRTGGNGVEITFGRNLSLAGLRKPFTKAGRMFDLGKGHITVSGNNVAEYSTGIPISDADYRKKNPTHARARAEYELKDGWHNFTIWDDWGTRHEVSISNDEEGDALAKMQLDSLKANNLLRS